MLLAVPIIYRGGANKRLVSTSCYLQPVDPTCEARRILRAEWKTPSFKISSFQDIQGAFLEPQIQPVCFYSQS
jgi:hypothetical protein